MKRKLAAQVMIGGAAVVLAIYLIHSHPTLAITSICLAGFVLTAKIT